VATEVGVSRPPTWLLVVAGAAVVASAVLLALAWPADDLPFYAIGYVLGCVVTIVLVALYFQLDKRRATSRVDYRTWAGSVPVMRLLLVAGFVVGAVHAGLLAHALALS
jgi:hypothetical protein